MQAQHCFFNILILFTIEHSHSVFVGKKRKVRKDNMRERKGVQERHKEGGRKKKTGISKKNKLRIKQLWLLYWGCENIVRHFKH